MEFRQFTIIALIVISITYSNCSTLSTTALPSSSATTVGSTGDKLKTPISVKRQLKNNFARRNPKFGLNFTMPGLSMSSMDTDTFLGPTGFFGGTNLDKTGPNVLGDLATIAAPIVLLKGVSIAILKIIKTIILPPIFLLVLLAFLIAGAVYFASSIVGSNGMSNAFSRLSNTNRNTFEFEQPLYNALDNANQKYGEYSSSYHNYNNDKGNYNNAVTEHDYTTYQYPSYYSPSYNSYNHPKKDNEYKIRS